MNPLSKTAERRLNTAKIESFVNSNPALFKAVNYSTVASLLTIGTKTAGLMYDYGVEIAERVLAKKPVEQQVLQLVSKIDLYDFLITYRKIAGSNPNAPSSEFYTYYLILFSLVLDIKVGMNVIGFNSGTGEVFVDDEYPTPTEVMILLSCDLGFSNMFSTSPKKLVDYIKMKYGDDVIEKVILRATKITLLNLLNTQAIREIEKRVLMNVAQAGVIVEASMLFNDKYTPQSYLDAMNWERESMTGNNANFCLMMLATMGDIFRENNIFKERQKLLNEEGIVLELPNEIDNITHVKVSEIHEEESEEHYLVITYWNEGAARTIPISLTEPDAISCLALYEVDLTMIELVMYWLGVLEPLTEFVDEMPFDKWKDVFNANRPCSDDDLHYMQEFVVETFRCVPFEQLLNGVKYLRPQHWNYSGTTKFNKKKEKKVESDDYFYELRKIGAHVRKLQNGQHASPEKEDAARRYMLELKPGYTLVDGYTRKQRVKAPKTQRAMKSIVCERV